MKSIFNLIGGFFGFVDHWIHDFLCHLWIYGDSLKMKNHLVIKETTKNAEYDLLTYEVSADRLKLHGYQNKEGRWIHYDHPLFFNPKGRTFTTLHKI